MLLEIATPYDTQDAADVHDSFASLFQKLAEMTADSGFDQQEITILRWSGWKERDAARAQGNEDAHIILEIDSLI